MERGLARCAQTHTSHALAQPREAALSLRSFELPLVPQELSGLEGDLLGMQPLAAVEVPKGKQPDIDNREFPLAFCDQPEGSGEAGSDLQEDRYEQRRFDRAERADGDVQRAFRR